jgi:hypothetical protein
MTGGPIRLSFRIDAYQPNTIPMARLAEYMVEIAAMIGERASVHFVELKPGSVQLIHDVEYEAYPKIEARALDIRNGAAPADAMKAYRTLDKKLAEDNTFGDYIVQDSGNNILDFPGARAPKPVSIAPVEQLTTIDGQIIGVGGRQISVNVPILIEMPDHIQPCITTRGMAKELRNFFLEEERRFHGRGQWTRDENGAWLLKTFTITSHEPLDNRPLSVLVDELRAVPSQLSEIPDPWNELMKRRDEGEAH